MDKRSQVIAAAFTGEKVLVNAADISHVRPLSKISILQSAVSLKKATGV